MFFVFLFPWISVVTLTPRGWILSCYAKQHVCFEEWVDIGICCLVGGLRWEFEEPIVCINYFCQIEVHTVFLLGHEQRVLRQTHY